MIERGTRRIGAWIDEPEDVYDQNDRLEFVSDCFKRFKRQDWGEISQNQRQRNVSDPGNAIGVYTYEDGTVIWCCGCEGEAVTAMFPGEWAEII